MECSECHVPLVRGYLCDRGDNQDGVTDWVEGPPEYGIFFGVKTRNRRRLPVESWRCPNCGKLNFYARAATNV